jgi:hypothetical protein
MGAAKIVDRGPAAERFNLVLLAEGYRQGDLPLFTQHARAFANFLASTPPFDTNCRALNVYRVDVVSRQAAADDPAVCGGSGRQADTYFDASFCGDGVIRRLLVANTETVIDVLNAQVPEWDQALVLVNSGIYGGSGGTIGVSSISGDWRNVAIHELGHSVFGLADEYDYWSGCHVNEGREFHPPAEPVEPNVTIERDPSLIKWRELIGAGTPIPTMENPNCSQCDSRDDLFPGATGLYEGAHYYHCDAFRPAFDCMMRNFEPFCPVCTRRIEDTLRPYQPSEPVVCDAGGPYVAECAGASTMAQVDGTGSSIYDCRALTFSWTGDFLEPSASGPTPTVTFSGLGPRSLSLRIDGGATNGTCQSTVTVRDSLAPTIVAPKDVSTCVAVPDIGTATALDGCDPSVAVTNNAPPLFARGETRVTWTATDASGNRSTAVQRVTIHDLADATPPELAVALSPSVLWPPTRRLVQVDASIVARDRCDESPAVRLLSITSNEPAVRGRRRETLDIVGASLGTDDRSFLLRASRDTTGTGRVYTVTYEAVDANGNATTARARVSVPRLQLR